mmetsp:Transcript_2998/g.4044  ORF Transcript_2998/g.4044 Transcript_2998/m.4044 type:complete len:407 (-) Transcript_2998:83-1303(-)
MSHLEESVSVDLEGAEAREAFAKATSNNAEHVLKSVRFQNFLSGNSNVTKDAMSWVTATVLQVDTMKAEFTVDLELELIYLDDSLKTPADFDPDYDGYVALKEEDVNEIDLVIPRVNLENCNSSRMTFYNVEVNFLTKEVFIQWNWIAIYHETMKLHKFPYDRQLLRIYIEVADINPLKPEDYPLPKRKWPKDNPARVESQLMDFNQTIGSSCVWSETPDPAFETMCTVTVEVERETKFYVVNYTLIIFLIVALNSAVLSFESLDERMQYTASLFLTLVAFKFVMMQSIPPVGYTTYLDRYVLAAFVWLTLGVLANCLRSYVAIEEVLNTTEQKSIDLAIQAVILGSWILLHAIVVFLSLCGGLRQSWKTVYAENNEEVLYGIHTKKSRVPNTKYKEMWGVYNNLE